MYFFKQRTQLFRGKGGGQKLENLGTFALKWWSVDQISKKWVFSFTRVGWRWKFEKSAMFAVKWRGVGQSLKKGNYCFNMVGERWKLEKRSFLLTGWKNVIFALKWWEVGPNFEEKKKLNFRLKRDGSNFEKYAYFRCEVKHGSAQIRKNRHFPFSKGKISLFRICTDPVSLYSENTHVFEILTHPFLSENSTFFEIWTDSPSF